MLFAKNLKERVTEVFLLVVLNFVLGATYMYQSSHNFVN